MVQFLNRLWIRLSIAFVLALLIGTFLPTALFEIGLRTGLIAPLPTPDMPFSGGMSTEGGIGAEGVTVTFESEAEFQAWPVENGLNEAYPLQVYEIAFWEETPIPERTLLTIAGIISLILGSILGVTVSRNLSHPLSNLVTATNVIKNRELDYRAQVAGTAEMQVLGRSFNEMASSLEASELARRNMMADVAHELRTPLSVIDGNLRAMLDGVFPMTEDELGLLHEQTTHLTRLVNDVRELSLAEAKQLPLHLEPLDMALLIEETVATFSAIAHEHEVALSVASSGELVLSADKNRLRQVLHNLLANAIQHTPAGGTVLVTGSRVVEPTGDPAIALAIQDSGVGLTPESLATIFDRFQRSPDEKRADSGGSMGLGLSIVKAIVELHNGTITASSAGPNQGCTFKITLPIC